MNLRCRWKNEGNRRKRKAKKTIEEGEQEKEEGGFIPLAIGIEEC